MGTRAPIHECLVTTHDARGKAHEFLIAYQERPELPPNEALNEILPDISFRGELVVMQSGKRVFVVDLAGGRMATLAKEAVRSFLLETAARRAHNKRLTRMQSIPVLLR
ncbi:hypothetical protein NUW54_g490 [Trametes sanguinea]|uniref:Uncharacterized protein n=1 Tax=Trametes sanguinea TaxID=158606 RepID=A0ACC1QC69_9APHY|nr:hypothetical protein NUW54_g490 [Trametes sanguinea]